MFCRDCHQTKVCEDCINADLEIAASMRSDVAEYWHFAAGQKKNISSGEDAFFAMKCEHDLSRTGTV